MSGDTVWMGNDANGIISLSESHLVAPAGVSLAGRLGSLYTTLDSSTEVPNDSLTLASNASVSGIRLKAHPSQTGLVVSGANVTVDDMKITNGANGILVSQANLHITNSRIYNNGTGIAAFQATGLDVRGSGVFRNSSVGLYVEANATAVSVDLSQGAANTIACNKSTTISQVHNIIVSAFDGYDGSTASLTIAFSGARMDHAPALAVESDQEGNCPTGFDICSIYNGNNTSPVYESAASSVGSVIGYCPSE